MSQGQIRPAWFDIASLPPHPNDFDGAGIAGSIHAVEQIILEEVQRGVHPRKIFLVGFSQGAALSLMTGLTTLHDLGGIGSLSGWIPHMIRDVGGLPIPSRESRILIHRFQHILENASNLPVFWGLGYSDTEIPFRYALNSVEFLEEQVRIPHGSLTIKEYQELGHETSDEELLDLADWLDDAMKIAYESTDSGSS